MTKIIVEGVKEFEVPPGVDPQKFGREIAELVAELVGYRVEPAPFGFRTRAAPARILSSNERGALRPPKPREMTMTEWPTTRAEAMRLGAHKYFTGKRCPHGHLEGRYTIGGNCVRCRINATTKYYHKHRAEQAAAQPRKDRG